jgi:DivIVA domain-containing protein
VDRDEIERRDFPSSRRGYDPSAVDEHLRRVADDIDRARAGAAPPAPPEPPAPRLSAGTSEQVRLILEAAEQSAARLREDAGREAGEHVARVGEAAAEMIRKLDGLERELGGLLDALRTSGERLEEGLGRLHDQVREAAGGDAVPAGIASDPREAPAEPGEPAAPAEPAEPAPAADEAGARLIALNMALDGTPREEAARYLAEHFTLADAEGLLDDVYSRADG